MPLICQMSALPLDHRGFLFNACLGYQNLKLNAKSSYLTTFTCYFGGSRFTRLPFGVEPPSNMFQSKINEIFKDLLNVFSIIHDILIVGYDTNGRDHDRTVKQEMQICYKENIRLNKNKSYFRCMKILCFGVVICREGVQLNPKKLCTLTEMALPNNKKDYNHSQVSSTS